MGGREEDSVGPLEQKVTRDLDQTDQGLTLSELLKPKIVTAFSPISEAGIFLRPIDQGRFGTPGGDLAECVWNGATPMFILKG